MTRPGFATQQELLRWAGSIPARGGLPRLIRRLVMETGGTVRALDFPADEGTAVGGWDGLAVAETATTFVPGGRSLWELSAGKSTSAKATKDYDKRSTTPDGRPTTESTYVAVSLRRWADRRTWATERAQDSRWKEVRAYGIDDLETWLESAPITHAWISEQLGLKPHGLQTADGWWQSWSTATDPPLVVDVVLAGRESAAKKLREALGAGPQITTIRADSLDEVLAVVAAVAMEDDAAGHSELLARTAFVDDVGTWRSLAAHDRPLVLVARTPEVIAEARSAPNHHVIVPLSGAHDADIEVPPIDASAAAAALQAAGMQDDRQADEVARLGRRSLLALRRRLARKPELHTPPWAHQSDRGIRGMLLAGSWNDTAAGDQQVLSELTGCPYEELRERLTQLAAQEDPFVTRVGNTWTIVSPYDAWRQLRHHLRPDDLQRLQPIIEQVLLEEDPAAEFAPEERWRAGFEGKTRQHSADLRGGVVTTVALLGALGDRVDAGHGATGINVANALVRGLLSKANEDNTSAVWSRLSTHLPLIAEAAPDAFLEAVRSGVVGGDPVLARLFQDSEDSDPLFTSSAHIGLLWALEVAAWSPAHLGQSVDLLARLAELDPGGRFRNRPSNTLDSIFCPWHPETTAPNQRRLEILDELRKRHPGVAWPLMVALLPQWHGIHHPTVGPRFRDWKPSRVAVPNVQYFEFITALVDRLVEDAANDPSRWQKLVEESDQVSPTDREKIRKELAHRVEERLLDPDGLEALWDQLRAMIARHREFADTDWALPSDELDALEAIEKALAPEGAVQANAWLFIDHMPDLGGDGTKRKDGEYDHAGYTVALDARRREAVSKIDKADGWKGVLALVGLAEIPWAVGDALAQVDGGAHEDECLALLESEDPKDEHLAGSYFGRRYHAEGWKWLEKLLSEASLSPRQVARLLLVTHDHPRSWERADELGEEIARQYWQMFSPSGLGSGFGYVEEVARRLLGAGRPSTAITLLVLYATRDDAADQALASVVADTLEALLEAGDSDPGMRGLRHYDLDSAFDFLEKHRDLVGPDRVARLEWGFLPALGFEPTIPSLHQALADHPAFFADVLSAIYRRHSDPPRDEVTPEEQQLASNAYRLLASWERPPGLKADGTMETGVLRGWINTVLPLLDEADRRDGGEIHIGHVLAFTPADSDGAWPCASVRDLLEDLQSDKIEEGLQTQIFNNRGITSRNPEAGGDQERDLAKKYTGWAERFSDRWPRAAAILRSLATTYEQDARQQDGEAERRRKGLEP